MKKFIVVFITFATLFLASCQPAAPVPTSTPEPTVTATKTNEPTKKIVPSVTASPEPLTQSIPGTDIKQLISAMQNIGIPCQTTGEKNIDGSSITQCTRKNSDCYLLADVLISGDDQTINSVAGSLVPYTNSDGRICAELFISYLATLPYDSATPDETKAWAKSLFEKINNDDLISEERIVGTAKFNIYLSTTMVSIIIEKAPLLHENEPEAKETQNNNENIKFNVSDSLYNDKQPGIYLVNIDIAPGIWRNNGTSDECYWEITTEKGDVIDNHIGMSGGTANIPETAFQVTFEKECGTWAFLK